SARQIAVSTASIWQKKGRWLENSWCRQCWSRRWVTGVTPQSLGLGSARQDSRWPRISLMIGVGLYPLAEPSSASRAKDACARALPAFERLAFGTGVTYFERLRPSMGGCSNG